MAINILDEERNRQAAFRYRSFSVFRVPEWRRLLCTELLHQLARSPDRREREAAKWLYLVLKHDATVQEIAKLRGSGEAAVRNLLKLGICGMRTIAG